MNLFPDFNKIINKPPEANKLLFAREDSLISPSIKFYLISNKLFSEIITGIS